MGRRLAIVLSGLLIAGCGPGTHSVNGTLTAYGSPANGYANANTAVCLPANAAEDFLGAQAELDDETGTIISLTKVVADSPAVLGMKLPYICRYVFHFKDVPDAKFYQVKIGSHLFAPESAAQVAAADWNFPSFALR